MIPGRILSLPLTSTNGAGEEMCAASGATGFDAIMLDCCGSPFALDVRSLAGVSKAANCAGLRLFAQLDLHRFPEDHKSVESVPDAFFRHAKGNIAATDPRTALPPDGEAWARLDRFDLCCEIAADVANALIELADGGLEGIVLVQPNDIDPRLLAQIADALPENFVLLAEAAERLNDEKSIDGYVLQTGNEAIELDGLGERIGRLGCKRPVLCAITNTNSPIDSFNAELCAALSAGIVVPEALPGEQAAQHHLSANDMACRYASNVRRLPLAGGPMAYLRTKTGDPRTSEMALLILTNSSHEVCSAPEHAELARAVAPFVAPTLLNELAPQETRCIEMTRSKPILQKRPRISSDSLSDLPRLVVENVSPTVASGDFPVKRVVGDEVVVEATIYTDGHEQLAAELQWRAIDEKKWRTARMEPLPNDRWRATLTLERMGRHEYVVTGWLDRFGGFRRDFAKKLEAGVAQPVDHSEGCALIGEALGRTKGRTATALKKKLAEIEKAKGEKSAKLLLGDELASLMDAADDRAHALSSQAQSIDAERIEARFSSWYELFPRSMTEDKQRHGSFADVIDHLPRVRAMGFDTLYFPPIHPIGKTNRKGPNNTLTPEDGDPGSPYAIGSDEGGHDAIHPELGTFDDFDRLVKAAADHGLEIALDFAIQCSPDHPWLKEHPGWFAWRPDGSMKYAENPPKKYQDIVNVDFYGPDAVPGLWEALRDVILLWVSHGVKTFRVDNPHTKPLPFWEWMIGEVRAKHPEVIFLSEAFTRPTLMYRLAKAGFSQSYTYFTWRNEKQELIDYITELTTEAPKDFYRPHFFVNTPDINPHFLQTGGRPAHRIRSVLAATLSGLWGVYSGFELCDATPLGPEKEEYLDSEKFEIRPREWRSSNDIVDDISRLNELRSANPALQTHLNTRFYPAYNDNIIWYGKPAPDGSAMIMVMVNLDPKYPHECDFEVPLWEFGLGDDASIAVEDLFGGYRFDWQGKVQHIALDPDEPFRIWRLSSPEGLTTRGESA